MNRTMSRQRIRRNQEHKNTRAQRVRIYALMPLCTYALLLAGCAQPQHQTTAGQVLVRDIGKAETLAIIEDVLANMHFTIDKADIQSGVVRTRPLPGAQFFELWRSDNAGPDNSFQANLHTIRRTAELNLAESGGQLRVGCVVRVQRLSLPERELRSSARGYEMFSRSSSVVQRLELHPEQEKNLAWIELPNDVLLANEILHRIEARIGSRTGGDPQATGGQT